MGYHRIDPSTLSPTEDFPCDRRSLAEAAGFSTLVASVFLVAPGEDLARAYHYHEHREELFYVLAGTLHVETPEGEYRVPEGEALAVGPDSPIRPHVPAGADAPARVLGVGAPAHDPARTYDPGGENGEDGEDGDSGDGDTDGAGSGDAPGDGGPSTG